jgi:polysaccharide deacetylase 2 family uncharacterized protein YibQ
MGGRFESERGDMTPILAELRRRGLMYVDNHASPQSVAPAVAAELRLPFAAAGKRVDAEPSVAAIDAALGELETAARHDGSSIGIAAASQPVIERVAAWAQTLESRGLVLAPASALAAVSRPSPVADAAATGAKPLAAPAPKP